METRHLMAQVTKLVVVQSRYRTAWRISEQHCITPSLCRIDRLDNFSGKIGHGVGNGYFRLLQGSQ